MKYKVIENGFITSLFTSDTPIVTDGYTEIDTQEYDRIKSAIESKPQGNYQLSESLVWIESEVEA